MKGRWGMVMARWPVVGVLVAGLLGRCLYVMLAPTRLDSLPSVLLTGQFAQMWN